MITIKIATKHNDDPQHLTYHDGEAIHFFVGRGGGRELARFEADGDIYIKGKLAESDKEVVAALREFLIASGHLRRP